MIFVLLASSFIRLSSKLFEMMNLAWVWSNGQIGFACNDRFFDLCLYMEDNLFFKECYPIFKFTMLATEIFYCCKIDCYNLVSLTFQFWSGLVGNNRGYLFACENLEMVICAIKMTKIFLHFRYWIKTKLNNNKQLLLLQRLSSKIALSFSFYQMYNALSSLCSVLDI